MSRSRRTGRLAMATAAATAMALVAVPIAAQAAPARPVHKNFAARGLVLRHTSTTVTLLASSVKKGAHRSANRTLTVTLPSRRTSAGRALARRLARTHTGDGISVTGTASGGRLIARNFADQPAPFHAYLGTVTAINDSLLTLAKAGRPSDDAREGHTGSFTVDTSDAAITLDGQPVDAALNLGIGQTVAVLGSSVDDVVVATSVWAFTTAPAVVAGHVTAVSGPLLTVASHGDVRHRNDGGQGDGGTQVSLDSATLIVDGASNSPVTAVTVGSRLLALGSDGGNGIFNASLAFVFTHGCSSRHHGDGGQGSDDGS